MKRGNSMTGDPSVIIWYVFNVVMSCLWMLILLMKSCVQRCIKEKECYMDTV